MICIPRLIHSSQISVDSDMETGARCAYKSRNLCHLVGSLVIANVTEELISCCGGNESLGHHIDHVVISEPGAKVVDGGSQLSRATIWSTGIRRTESRVYLFLTPIFGV